MSKADEIKVRFNDQDRIINYLEDYPEKTIILTIPKDVPEEQLKWSTYSDWAETGRFILALKSLHLYEVCQNLKIPFYWDYPIFTWYELRAIVALNPCYLILSAPLFFQLDKVTAATDISIRAFPNIAYDNYIPKQDGICGTWIRPEDTETYEQYITTFEFYENEPAKEEVLRHIYQDNKSYLGNLSLLIKNLNEPIDNRTFDEEFAKMRMTCGQRCKISPTCNFCNNVFKYGEILKKLSNIKRKFNEQKENT